MMLNGGATESDWARERERKIWADSRREGEMSSDGRQRCDDSHRRMKIWVFEYEQGLYEIKRLFLSHPNIQHNNNMGNVWCYCCHCLGCGCCSLRLSICSVTCEKSERVNSAPEYDIFSFFSVCLHDRPSCKARMTKSNITFEPSTRSYTLHTFGALCIHREWNERASECTQRETDRDEQ